MPILDTKTGTNRLMSKLSKTVRKQLARRLMMPLGLCVTVCLALGGCSVGGQPETVWKGNPAMETALAPRTKVGASFSIKPPLYYQPNENNSQSNGYVFKDSQQFPSVRSTTPLYPGSAQIVPCETDTVPHELDISLRLADKPNSQQSLLQLCEDEVHAYSIGVETKNFTKTPAEFGQVNGLKFCKGAWSADIPRQRRFAGASMNVPVPAQGICYVTISDGKIVALKGLAPKGDSALGVIEQSILSFQGSGDNSDNMASGGGSTAPLGPPITSPRALFDRFKQLDLANDPHVIDLYAEDAKINMFGVPYPRPAYAAFIATTYKSAPDLNARTQYDEPVIDNVTDRSAHLVFTARNAGAHMKADWTLRRSAQGSWQIVSETSQWLK